MSSSRSSTANDSTHSTHSNRPTRTSARLSLSSALPSADSPAPSSSSLTRSASASSSSASATRKRTRNDLEAADAQSSSSTSSTAKPNKGKGRAVEPPSKKTRRITIATSTPASRPNPSSSNSSDRKGKGKARASPSPSLSPPPALTPEEEEEERKRSAPSPPFTRKRAYSLRSTDSTTTLAAPSPPTLASTRTLRKGKGKAVPEFKKPALPSKMPRKARTSSITKKSGSAAGSSRISKGNSSTSAGSSRNAGNQNMYGDDDDVFMSEDDYHVEESTDDDKPSTKNLGAGSNAASGSDPTKVKSEFGSSDASSALARALAGAGGGGGSGSAGLDALRSMYGFGGGEGGGGGMGGGSASRLAESLAQSLFQDPYGSSGLFGRPSGGAQSRMRTMLTGLRSKSMSTQLSALQEASEFLSISTEDTLSGYFDLDGFIKEFIRILKGDPYLAPAEAGGSGRAGSRGPAESAPSGSSAAAAAAAADSGESSGEGGDQHAHRSDHDESDSENNDGHDDDDDDEGHDYGGDMMDDEEYEDAELMRILALSAREAKEAEQAAAAQVARGASGDAGAVASASKPADPPSFSASSFGAMDEEPSSDKLEAQLLACRCLANLMEALPGCAHTVVSHGAVPILCAKLLEIQYIDLAEQTLSTMEKISQEYPIAIVREGGLGALLNYLDFFSTNVQRTAVTAAANCCRNVSQDYFNMVRDVFPMLRNVLAYPDQRLVEQAALAVLRSVESFRHKPECLETLLDVDVVRSLNTLLMPAAGSSLLSPGTYTHLLRALGAAAKVSAKVTLAFLEAGMVDTIYQILTGVVPGALDADEQGASEGGQGLGGGLKDMVVLQNLAHRPKDQIEETLTLICELLPPLPKDGVFDPKAYTEKALARMVKAKAKAHRASARQQAAADAGPLDASGTTSPATGSIDAATGLPILVGADDLSAPSPIDEASSLNSYTGSKNKEIDQAIEQRLDVLKAHPDLVRRFVELTIPVLVDVYAATVAVKVRTKVLNALLKTVSYLSSEDLKETIKTVRLASLLGSIMSSRDNPALTLGALQLIELLIVKLPDIYKTGFRREGVMFEVDALAAEDLTTSKLSKKPTASSTPTTVKTEPDEAPTLASLSSLLNGNPTGSANTNANNQSSQSSSRRASTGTGVPANTNPGLSPFLASSAAPAKRSSPLPLDPKDANILRARVLRFNNSADRGPNGQEDEAARSLRVMKGLVERLNDEEADELELKDVLAEIADLFAGPDGGVSSFELLKGGLVDGLLECSTINGKASATVRRRLLFEMFSKTDSDATSSPFAVLVKRLQESLSRMETFEVATAFAGNAADDSRRSSTALLARQIRLKLVAAEGSDIPKSAQAMVVSIQAIATLQALNDYLRPRLTAPALGTGSRLEGSDAAPPSTSSSTNANAASTSASASTNNAPKADSSSEEKKPLTRRRSARLSGRAPDESDPTAASEGESSSAPEGANPPFEAASASDGAAHEGEHPSLAAMAMAMAMGGGESDDVYDDEEGYSDEYDDDMFDGDMEDMPRPAEKTVDVTVTEDGSKVVAQTPNGSRVDTPVQAEASAEAGPSSHPAVGGARGSSYASALKTTPSDWHLEFSMNGNVMPLDTTVYGAVHRHESLSGIENGIKRGVWSGIYTITFKKVPGPAPAVDSNKTPEPSTRDPSSATAVPSSVPADSAQAKILRLLRVLHALNSEAQATSPSPSLITETAFVNNKLTAKLGRQLEEPMILASNCLPDWAQDLPRFFPFLFPFETRFSFLNLTSFGYSRLIQKWQSQQERGNDHRTDDALGFLARLPRQKVRISRNHLLESAVKVFELYGTTTSILEIEYFEEVGTGLGPTLEFYAIASKEFGRRDLHLWRDADSSGTGDYVHRPQGFFPSAAASDDVVFVGTTRTKFFRILGQFVAKALLDSRIIDMAFNPIFMKLIQGDEVVPSIQALRMVDVRMAKSLDAVQQFAEAKLSLVFDDDATAEDKAVAYDDVTVNNATLKDFSLDFTLPGSDIELKDGGADIAVDMSNVEEYVRLVLDWTLVKGVKPQVDAFRAGFSTIFPVSDLRAFSPDELVILFGSAEEDWSSETLNDVLKADHGYNSESSTIANLIEVMAAYDAGERREYLQFVTGAPKLPIGGFRGLNPPLTVVRKGHEPPLKADDYLPSVMTCVNYLKLPDYSSREVLADKLHMAMKEGGGAFHLS